MSIGGSRQCSCFSPTRHNHRADSQRPRRPDKMPGTVHQHDADRSDDESGDGEAVEDRRFRNAPGGGDEIDGQMHSAPGIRLPPVLLNIQVISTLRAIAPANAPSGVKPGENKPRRSRAYGRSTTGCQGSGSRIARSSVREVVARPCRANPVLLRADPPAH